jgi:hypothetical protein
MPVSTYPDATALVAMGSGGPVDTFCKMLASTQHFNKDGTAFIEPALFIGEVQLSKL